MNKYRFGRSNSVVGCFFLTGSNENYNKIRKIQRKAIPLHPH